MIVVIVGGQQVLRNRGIEHSENQKVDVIGSRLTIGKNGQNSYLVDNSGELHATTRLEHNDLEKKIDLWTHGRKLTFAETKKRRKGDSSTIVELLLMILILEKETRTPWTSSLYLDS